MLYKYRLASGPLHAYKDNVLVDQQSRNPYRPRIHQCLVLLATTSSSAIRCLAKVEAIKVLHIAN